MGYLAEAVAGKRTICKALLTLNDCTQVWIGLFYIYEYIFIMNWIGLFLYIYIYHHSYIEHRSLFIVSICDILYIDSIVNYSYLLAQPNFMHKSRHWAIVRHCITVVQYKFYAVYYYKSYSFMHICTCIYLFIYKYFYSVMPYIFEWRFECLNCTVRCTSITST